MAIGSRSALRDCSRTLASGSVHHRGMPCDSQRRGSVVVCHPWMLHSPSPNRGTKPRLMTVQRIHESDQQEVSGTPTLEPASFDP